MTQLRWRPIDSPDSFSKDFFAGKVVTDKDAIRSVMAILDRVRQEGDAALFAYSQKFDKQDLASLRVPEKWLKQSYLDLDQDLKEALEFIKSRIETYEKQIKYQNKSLGEFDYIYHPIQRVGFYIPGGKAFYPSSVLMSIIAAQVAGVPEIYAVTPTYEPSNITFATLYICGVKNVYQIGGAQAIAALAYGTETIPKVDKIVGPGNKYVALAKRLVFGEVGIDSIAGPSEILLYVDETAKTESVVLDILAQAEHDPDAKTFLLSENRAKLDEIRKLILEEYSKQKRQDIIEQSLEHNHYSIYGKRDELLSLVNRIAPEHISIQHKAADNLIPQIKYTGAIFKGGFSPEAIGDYVAGPSHVLPTSGNARYSHGLNVNDFLTSHAVINIKQETYQEIAGYGVKVALAEGLYAHAESLKIRLKNHGEDETNL